MIPPEVVVIDYGVGNLLSVRRGLERVGAVVSLARDASAIRAARRLVLPGVGAFGNAMDALHAQELVPVIREVAERGVSLLGICLGMQLLFDQSEEFGANEGIGLIQGIVSKIPERSVAGECLKIPHIGWNSLVPVENRDWGGTLLADNDPGDSMYFVHSFMVRPSNPSHRLADCIYGGHRIPAVVRKGNITGCQFHPEKSGQLGLRILQRFVCV